MLQGLVAVIVFLTLVVLALLAWLISSSSAARRDAAGQVAGIALLQQQLDALKAAQDKADQGDVYCFSVPGASSQARPKRPGRESLSRWGSRLKRERDARLRLCILGTSKRGYVT